MILPCIDRVCDAKERTKGVGAANAQPVNHSVVSEDNPGKRNALARPHRKRLPTVPVVSGVVGSLFALGAVLMLRCSAMHKVIRRPGAGELHVAILQLLRGRGVLV